MADTNARILKIVAQPALSALGTERGRLTFQDRLLGSDLPATEKWRETTIVELDGEGGSKARCLIAVRM